jgi:hypothetical protein
MAAAGSWARSAGRDAGAGESFPGPRVSYRPEDLVDLLKLFAVVAVWWFLQAWLLPRLGVPT